MIPQERTDSLSGWLFGGTLQLGKTPLERGGLAGRHFSFPLSLSLSLSLKARQSVVSIAMGASGGGTRDGSYLFCGVVCVRWDPGARFRPAAYGDGPFEKPSGGGGCGDDRYRWLPVCQGIRSPRLSAQTRAVTSRVVSAAETLGEKSVVAVAVAAGPPAPLGSGVGAAAATAVPPHRTPFADR